MTYNPAIAANLNDWHGVNKRKDKFRCDNCADELEVKYKKTFRGMKLCPECREYARDHFGR